MTNPVREPAPLFTREGWSPARLQRLRDASRRHRGDLTAIAAATGISRERCDIALFDLLGRTPEQTFNAILHRETAR